MAVEPAICDCARCLPADDLIARLQQAATAAISDLAPTIERDRRRIKSVLFELDLDITGQVTSAHAWVDYRASVNRLLGTTKKEPA
jgi:hypothetical protein